MKAAEPEEDMAFDKRLATARARAYNSKEKFQKKGRIRTWRW